MVFFKFIRCIVTMPDFIPLFILFFFIFFIRSSSFHLILDFSETTKSNCCIHTCMLNIHCISSFLLIDSTWFFSSSFFQLWVPCIKFMVKLKEIKNKKIRYLLSVQLKMPTILLWHRRYYLKVSKIQHYTFFIIFFVRFSTNFNSERKKSYINKSKGTTV